MNIQKALVFLLSLFTGALAGQNPRQNQPTSEVIIQNAALVNSSEPDFSPAFYANGLVFVSSRLKGGMVDHQTGQTYFELFFSPFNQEGIPQKAKLFSLEVNSALHEGPVTFDREENTIFFTRSNQQMGVSKADKNGHVVLKIYQAVRGLYDWEGVTALPFNQDSFSCMHPALSPDGERLFFVSNMPGGYGGMDIYMVDREGTVWGDPINLGPEINTARDEAFPFMHESGVLFFASNGHGGLGGMDLFAIDIGSARWGALRNLEFPINTTYDDFGIIIRPDGKKGYFSSNRKGGKGKDDIYFFETPDGLQGILEPEVFILRLKIQDLATNQALSNAAIYIFERTPDGRIVGEGAYDVEVEGSDGDFALRMVRKPTESIGAPQAISGRSGEAVMQLQPFREYMIVVSKEGYKPSEVSFSPKSAMSGDPMVVALALSNCSTIRGVVRNTDGSPIPDARVRIINGCSREEKEVKSNAVGVFSYCAEIGCVYTLLGDKSGYPATRQEVSLVDVKAGGLVEVVLKPATSGESTANNPLGVGTIIVMDKIQYDFNKSVIRNGQARDLEALARLMTIYPGMEIELGAHTDCRGAADYNLQLSQERAESAKSYLVAKGIAAGRIKAMGYGESKPRNGCIDGVFCTESEYQFNVRTEVKVLKIDEPIHVSPMRNR